mmetsp:Transcript_33998/g.74606  ORF Transcript_33998/g.74606 Transcript_33998/m.74606 type:complete len:202 (-) Transcript_33998:222-827(-)
MSEKKTIRPSTVHNRLVELCMHVSPTVQDEFMLDLLAEHERDVVLLVVLTPVFVLETDIFEHDPSLGLHAVGTCRRPLLGLNAAAFKRGDGHRLRVLGRQLLLHSRTVHLLQVAGMLLTRELDENVGGRPTVRHLLLRLRIHLHARAHLFPSGVANVQLPYVVSRHPEPLDALHLDLGHEEEDWHFCKFSSRICWSQGAGQ